MLPFPAGFPECGNLSGKTGDHHIWDGTGRTFQVDQTRGRKEWGALKLGLALQVRMGKQFDWQVGRCGRDRCHSRDGSEADGAGGAEPMSQDSSLGGI